MFNVEVNKEKNLVKVTVIGFLKLDEATKLASDFDSTIKQFKPKEVLILANLSEFKPASPEVVLILQKLQAQAAEYSKKLASIHTNVVSQMQMKRTASETYSESNITRFKTEEEALNFLFS